MKKIITTSILFILILFIAIQIYSFIEKKRWDILIKNNAVYITKNITNDELNTFKEWSCGTRGEMQLWNKNNIKYRNFNICYYTNLDSTVIRCKKSEIYFKDLKLNYDSAIENYEFSKKGSEKIYVFGYNNNWDRTITDSLQDSIFQYKPNPFLYIKDLSNLKIKYKITGSSYQTKSEIIKFYLSNQHVLYYIPNSNNTEKLNLDKLIHINKHWYFKKLDVPLDNG